jgi:hypothetical protein
LATKALENGTEKASGTTHTSFTNVTMELRNAPVFNVNIKGNWNKQLMHIL